MGQCKALWSDGEEAALRAGVEKYGLGKWRLIKKDIQLGPTLISRSNVQLKDKWRNLTMSGTMRSMDANWVESPRKRPRNSDISTIIDIGTKKEKTIVADAAEFARMMPSEDIGLAEGHVVHQEAQAVAAYEAQAVEEIRLPEGHAVEEAQGIIAFHAIAAEEVDAEACWSRQMTATEAGSAVIKAVEATLAGLAVYKTAANEQKAAFAEVGATKEEHVAAAIENAQGAKAAAAIAKARVEKELRKACALAEYWCKCRNN